MYCPQCDLEIKGANQKECPICNAQLIENPFADMGQEDKVPDDDLKLKALIEDIDQKVSESLAEAEHEIKPERFETEPSESDFRLLPSESSPAPQMNKAEEEAFLIEPEEVRLESQEDITLEKAIESLQEPIVSSAEPEQVPVGETIGQEEVFGLTGASLASEHYPPPESDFSLFDVKAEILDEPPLKADEPNTNLGDEQQIRTKAILERALDELDSATESNPVIVKRSFISRTFAVAILVLVAAIGGGYYLLSIKEAPVVNQYNPQPVKQEEKVLKQILKKNSEQSVSNAHSVAPSKTAERFPAVTGILEETEKSLPIAAQPGEKDKNVVATSEKKAPAQKAEGIGQRPAAQSDTVQLKNQESKLSPQAEQTLAIIASRADVGPPQEEPKAAKKPMRGSFSVQAGSYQNRLIAESEEQKYKKNGLNAFIEKVDLGAKGTWYRVKIGSYVTHAEAVNVQKSMSYRYKGVETRIVRNK